MNTNMIIFLTLVVLITLSVIVYFLVGKKDSDKVVTQEQPVIVDSAAAAASAAASASASASASAAASASASAVDSAVDSAVGPCSDTMKIRNDSGACVCDQASGYIKDIESSTTDNIVCRVKNNCEQQGMIIDENGGCKNTQQCNPNGASPSFDDGNGGCKPQDICTQTQCPDGEGGCHSNCCGGDNKKIYDSTLPEGSERCYCKPEYTTVINSDNTTTCQQTINNCSEHDDSGNCTTCDEGYTLESNSCVSQTGNDDEPCSSILQERVDGECVLLDVDTSGDINCKPSFTDNTGSCTAGGCVEGYEYDSIRKICKMKNCDKYDENNVDCITCNKGFGFISGDESMCAALNCDEYSETDPTSCKTCLEGFAKIKWQSETNRDPTKFTSRTQAAVLDPTKYDADAPLVCFSTNCEKFLTNNPYACDPSKDADGDDGCTKSTDPSDPSIPNYIYARNTRDVNQTHSYCMVDSVDGVSHAHADCDFKNKTWNIKGDKTNAKRFWEYVLSNDTTGSDSIAKFVASMTKDGYIISDQWNPPTEPPLCTPAAIQDATLKGNVLKAFTALGACVINPDWGVGGAWNTDDNTALWLWDWAYTDNASSQPNAVPGSATDEAQPFLFDDFLNGSSYFTDDKTCKVIVNDEDGTSSLKDYAVQFSSFLGWAPIIGWKVTKSLVDIKTTQAAVATGQGDPTEYFQALANSLAMQYMATGFAIQAQAFAARANKFSSLSRTNYDLIDDKIESCTSNNANVGNVSSVKEQMQKTAHYYQGCVVMKEWLKKFLKGDVDHTWYRTVANLTSGDLWFLELKDQGISLQNADGTVHTFGETATNDQNKIDNVTKIIKTTLQDLNQNEQFVKNITEVRTQQDFAKWVKNMCSHLFGPENYLLTMETDPNMPWTSDASSNDGLPSFVEDKGTLFNNTPSIKQLFPDGAPQVTLLKTFLDISSQVYATNQLPTKGYGN